MVLNATWVPHSTDTVMGKIQQRTAAIEALLHHLILITIGELADLEVCIALNTSSLRSKRILY
jgi:hypothetical protein